MLTLRQKFEYEAEIQKLKDELKDMRELLFKVRKQRNNLMQRNNNKLKLI